MAGLACARPADAGRVILALAVSAALHAALLIPPGAPHADSNVLPGLVQTLQGGFPLRLTLLAPEPAPETAAVVAEETPALPVKPMEATGAPQTISLNESTLPAGKAPRYYLAHELDVRPQIRSRVNPEYPRSASEQGITANLVIRIYIDETGRVEKVAIPATAASGPFADAVSAAFIKAGYTPGIKDGQPVKSLVLIEVNFETVDETATFRGNRY